jgi:hypothetical protein
MLRLAVAISAVEGPPAKVRLTKQKYKWGKLLCFSSSPPDELNIEEHPYFIVETKIINTIFKSKTGKRERTITDCHLFIIKTIVADRDEFMLSS